MARNQPSPNTLTTKVSALERNVRLQWVTVGSAEYEQAREVRNAELLRPIGLADNSREADDGQALHLVACDGEHVVGTVLLVPGSSPKLRQMAVSRSMQRQGVGQLLVRELLRKAAEQGHSEVVCHARAEAASFYEKLGFVVEGEPFEEVGIEHRFMRHRL